MTKKEIANYIDYTNLSEIATKEDIARVCEEANTNSFRAVCVNPKYVEYARMCLDDMLSKVKLCTVIGYPLGENTQEIKAMEAVMAKESGADELDMVISSSALITGNYEYIYEEVRRVVDCTEIPVKVVFNSDIASEEQMVKLCEAIIEAGAKYICITSKTAPTQEIVKSVADMVAGVMEVKVMTNINTKDDLFDMICAGATRVGTNSAIKIIDNFKKK